MNPYRERGRKRVSHIYFCPMWHLVVTALPASCDARRTPYSRFLLQKEKRERTERTPESGWGSRGEEPEGHLLRVRDLTPQQRVPTPSTALPQGNGCIANRKLFADKAETQPDLLGSLMAPATLAWPVGLRGLCK